MTYVVCAANKLLCIVALPVTSLRQWRELETGGRGGGGGGVGQGVPVGIIVMIMILIAAVSIAPYLTDAGEHSALYKVEKNVCALQLQK